MSKVVVIGGGFSGLSAACFAAHSGHNVTLLEKNEVLGGRARYYKAEGFMFDMGPSWYWMPDVFERFFNKFGKSVSEYYKLVKLGPGFQIFFKDGETLQIPSGKGELYDLFEGIEKGSAAKLEKYLSEAKLKYEIGMQDLIYRPALSLMEYANSKVLKNMFKADLFTPLSKYVRTFFKDDRLIALMEFPVLFLGAMPQNIPALYSLMNYAALEQGTWYPMGGMYEIVKAMESLARELGVEIRKDSEVTSICSKLKGLVQIETKHKIFNAEAVIASCDYHHTEDKLIPGKDRNYTEKYWSKKTFAPSCLIFYIGVSKRVKKLIHHNLFFDTDMAVHAREIYSEPAWPSDPLFYICCPSKTDDTVAPPGMENLFILMPLAPGLMDTEALREEYFDKVMKRIEARCEDSITPYIVYKKSYCIKDFKNDYNAYHGNAYGLANTLRQTAILKPSIKNKKHNNFFYAGQLTVPGPGVPPSLISGEISAGLADNSSSGSAKN